MARSGLLLEAGLPVAMTSSQRGWAPIAAPARRIYSSVPTEVSYWTRAPSLDNIHIHVQQLASAETTNQHATHA